MAPEAPLLLATRSSGKLRELKAMLGGLGIRAIDLADAGIPPSPDEDAIECHETFEENALAKARHFHRLIGLPTLADDSGLCVDALDGAPGVWSKRYSGRTDLSGQALDDANNLRLLSELEGAEDRSASYRCAAAFVDGDEEVVTVGETAGAIVTVPAGTGGFGYDPYFFSTELGRTFGEASIEEKEAISHRARAFRPLLDALRARGGAL